MSLKFALLGFLSTEAASGFDLAREFGESVGWFWFSSHSQIYPELRRLETEGLVASTPSPGGPGKQKRIYRLTEQGETELQSWLEQPTEYAPIRDVERVKLVFLDQAPVEVIRRHLEDHKKHYEDLLAVYTQQLRELHRGVFPRLVKRLATRPRNSHEMITGLKVLAMQGNIARVRTEIHWAEDALSWLEGMEDQT
ncbi:PadR family transcriptional regulator [Streptomyces sporangiiformans]|uniref:PadR family transcriptional regulator n=1 Tax=Streptomyces sporangiiformans TaxID=2315329 RepID=A0A505CXZ0_9ACTN|nr:PadR family transcriptional regulator [Streptomyces sporangiiformans]TPQ16883.1 PadR family transcriptional regulator [Streptomyces sporangiiformans]